MIRKMSARRRTALVAALAFVLVLAVVRLVAAAPGSSRPRARSITAPAANAAPKAAAHAVAPPATAARPGRAQPFGAPPIAASPHHDNSTHSAPVPISGQTVSPPVPVLTHAPPDPLSGMRVVISGSAERPFYPGLTQSLDLTVTNPYAVPVTLTALTVTVQRGTTIGTTRSPNPSCSGTANMQALRYRVVGVVRIPAHATRALSAAGATSFPQVRMPDLATNQDACKNTTFHFTYDGLAQTP